MTRPELTLDTAMELIRAAIERIAPDVDASTVPCDVDIRIEAELDSMDFMAVLSTISDRTGVDVPESDVTSTPTIAGLADYVVHHANTAGSEPGSLS